MIRVVRIMEYEYDSMEQCNADMARWQVPPFGDKKFGPLAPLIRSAVMMPREVPDDLGVDSPAEGS